MNVLQKRLKFYEELIQYIYDNRKELIKKKKEHIGSDVESIFHYSPANYFPARLVKNMNSTLVDIINDMLWEYSVDLGDKKIMTLKSITDYLMPGVVK